MITVSQCAPKQPYETIMSREHFIKLASTGQIEKV